MVETTTHDLRRADGARLEVVSYALSSHGWAPSCSESQSGPTRPCWRAGRVRRRSASACWGFGSPGSTAGESRCSRRAFAAGRSGCMGRSGVPAGLDVVEHGQRMAQFQQPRGAGRVRRLHCCRLHPPQAGPARHAGTLPGGAPAAACHIRARGGHSRPAGLLRHDRAPASQGVGGAGGEEMVAERANERVCYFNGEIVPESRALVSFRDRSFRYGDGAFDTTRTFGHRIFKLEEHIVRFYKTLRYLRIDPGMAPSEMKRHTEEVLARNLHLLGPDDDYWVFQRISRGLEPAGGDFHGSTDPVLIIDCTPLPIAQRAHYLPRRHSVDGSLEPPRCAGYALAEGEDPQLPEPVRRERRGSPPRPQCPGSVPRPQRQSLRGRRLQHLPRQRRWHALHAAGPLRAQRHQPRRPCWSLRRRRTSRW